MYVQSDTLMLADVFENFRNKCIEICELYVAHFLSAPGLAWQAYLKKTEVKLELLTKIDMLLMAEKFIIWNKFKEYEKRWIETVWFIIQAKKHSILKHLKQ